MKIKIPVLTVLFIVNVFAANLMSASGISFNGSGSIDFGSNIDINIGNASGITIEMWLKPSINSTGWRDFFSCGDYLINFWEHNLRVWNYNANNWIEFPYPALALTPEKWTHLTIQINGDEMIVFIDGKTYSWSLNYPELAFYHKFKNMPLAGPSSAPTIIGKTFIGEVDELRISNIARYESTFAPSPTPFSADINTIGLWHFDEGSGSTTIDSSGNNNNGSISGGAGWSEDVFSAVTFRTYRPFTPVDPSPFGISIHLWNTRAYWLEAISGDMRPYDDGIDDGMTNSKIMSLLAETGAKWVRDYGQSDGPGFYWPEKIGYDYMDMYKTTLNYYRLNALHTAMGFSGDQSEYGLSHGYAPQDWPKAFNLQKEAALRYKDTIRLYKVGHEIDNIDACRWCDTCKNFVRYLKYAHDAIKSADPTIVVQLGDICRPIGCYYDIWNNGEYQYVDDCNGGLPYTDETALEKILYEITVNGNDSRYDTTALGGFPASTNPLDYFDGGVGHTCYVGNPPGIGWYDRQMDYLYDMFTKYGGIEREMDIQVQETAVDTTPTSDANAQSIIPGWRHIFRTGRISGAFFFHLDGISVWNNGNKEIGGFLMVDWDVDRDAVFDDTITKYPIWYAYKKMTHLSARLEEFDDDEFKETGGTKFYNTGWIISNFNSWNIANSNFTGQTSAGANLVLRDLVLPTWRWRIWGKLNWQEYGMNRYFTVRMKSDRSGTATLYWDNVSETYNESDFSDIDNSVNIAVTGDNAYHIYTLDLSQNPNWEGVVAAIRFDPTGGNGDNIEIDYLGFTNTGEGTEVSISVDASPRTLLADGASTSNITATVVDDMGIPVPTSTAEITFNITGGGGTLVGTNPVNASGGRASITYRSGTQEGTATISASSPGLTQGSVNITLIINDPPEIATNLLCNGQPSPGNLTDLNPDLSWTFNDPDISSGDKQSAYRILVANSLIEIDNNNGNMWDTTKVNGVASTAEYQGAQLEANQTYYWKVMTWDSYNEPGPYSQVSTFTMGADIDPRAFYGIPMSIPGKIECEDFDNGGEGIAYHDNDSINNGNQYRATEGVDLEVCSDTEGVYNVGWTEAGEWLEYTVDVMATDTYTINVRAASDGAGNDFHISFDGQDKTGTMTTPDTGGWQIYTTITKTAVSLSQGKQVMRLAIDGGGTGSNLNYINVVAEGQVSPEITVTTPVGGEVWEVGTQAVITWTSQGAVGDAVGIELSTNGGSTWTTLISGTANDGNHQATVPNMPSTNCRIRVREPDGSPSDMSDSNFTIEPSQTSTIQVTIPNGGENWVGGTERTVAWTYSGTAGNIVNIDLSTDGGATWTTLISNTANDELESVTVPDLSSTQCRIRVGEPDGSPSDMSDSNFTIVNTPVLKLSKTELDFGNVDIGASKGLWIQITNGGGGTLFGTVTSDKKWIGVSLVSFATNYVDLAVIVYNDILNESKGKHTGTISIKTNGGDTDIPVTLTATCVLPKPNPYDPTKGDLTFFGDGIVSNNTSIRIYTLDGELIKTLNNVGQGFNLANKIQWDGKNENGNEVTNGIYIYIYESSKEKGIGKFTVISK